MSNSSSVFDSSFDMCVSQRTTQLVKASDVNFYEILRNKLGGK